jgi:hypothetical protein
MEETSNTHWEHEKCIKYYGRETSKEDTVLEIKAWIQLGGYY